MDVVVSLLQIAIQMYKFVSHVTQDGDKYDIAKEMSGICRLTIKDCEIEDSGEYSCTIDKQDDKTTTLVTIIGKCTEYP